MIAFVKHTYSTSFLDLPIVKPAFVIVDILTRLNNIQTCHSIWNTGIPAEVKYCLEGLQALGIRLVGSSDSDKKVMLLIEVTVAII